MKEFEKFWKESDKVCPDCGTCPTCGKRLWPTPHGPEPCHPWDYDRPWYDGPRWERGWTTTC